MNGKTIFVNFCKCRFESVDFQFEVLHVLKPNFFYFFTQIKKPPRISFLLFLYKQFRQIKTNRGI